MTRCDRSDSRVRRILIATLAGTSIELFDFYIYGTASVLVFPTLFFPSANRSLATLESLITFSIAFLARPLGSVLFGHLGDRVGRKATLVTTMLVMGLATLGIGVIPPYSKIGLVAPFLLAFFRFCQGIGLGGEWGGAVVVATENAPANARVWFGIFPQLGAPIGFFLAGLSFVCLTRWLSTMQFIQFGWRLPFLSSFVLVLIALYYRIILDETPAFVALRSGVGVERRPVLTLLKTYPLHVIAGTLSSLSTFVLFYVVSVFCLHWATASLGYDRSTFLTIQLCATPLFALSMPLSALLAERGRTRAMAGVTVGIALFGLFFAQLFSRELTGTVAMMLIAMLLMGLTYGPLSTVLAELFPARVRYSGCSLCYSFGAILGASLAPYTALWLAEHRGLRGVGLYISLTSVITLISLLASPRRRVGDDVFFLEAI